MGKCCETMIPAADLLSNENIYKSSLSLDYINSLDNRYVKKVDNTRKSFSNKISINDF